MSWQTHSSTQDEKVRICATCGWRGYVAGERCPACGFPLPFQELRDKKTPLSVFELQREMQLIQNRMRYHRSILKASPATEGLIPCPDCGRAMPTNHLTCRGAPLELPPGWRKRMSRCLNCGTVARTEHLEPDCCSEPRQRLLEE